jgi:septum site-determining protein MinD
MKKITFTVSKGGVGKSLITANVAASLAAKGQKVILVEGDPNHPLQLILNVSLSSGDILLDGVVKQDLKVDRAVYQTNVENLFLVPSGVSLQGYFDLDPIKFAAKIADLKADFLFIDTPFPLGKAALLSLGVCDYFIPILTEDEFVLCVESAIDTIRLGKYYLKCTPLGFILNRIKTIEKFNKDFVRDLEDLLELSCLATIKENPIVSKSYGGPSSQKAFLAYDKVGSDFRAEIDKITQVLLGKLPATHKENTAQFLEGIIKH